MTIIFRRVRSVTQSASQQFHPAINGRNQNSSTLKIIVMFRRKLTALDYHNPDGFDNTGKKNKTKCEGALKCDSVIWNVSLDNVRAKLQFCHQRQPNPFVKNILVMRFSKLFVSKKCLKTI